MNQAMQGHQDERVIVKNSDKMWSTGEGNGKVTPVFLPGKSHGQRNLVDYSLWCCRRVGQDLATEQQQQPYVKTDANKYYSYKWL